LLKSKNIPLKKQGLCYKNIFLTNIEIIEDNVFKIMEGGRFRWKIEHSFNREKNIEFSLEHTYSHKPDKPEKLLIVSKIFLLKLQEYF